MKAIQLTAYGKPLEHLNFVEVNDLDIIENDEALIEVLYSPVNPSDLLLANGTYPIHPELPSTIGGEGVGRVVSIGQDVTNVKPEDIVTIPLGTFAWSEKVVAKAEKLIPLPAGIDLQQAAMVSINPPTAVLLLEEFVTLETGDWIVLNAANSSVGHTIIAVAKSKGLKILGIVRRKEAVDIVLAAGADVVLVEDENLITEAKKLTNDAVIKLALDAVGGKAAASLAQILGTKGHLVSYAALSREALNISPLDLIFKDVTVHGFFMYLPQYEPKVKNAKIQSYELLAQGKLNVPIAKIYPPAKIKEAIQHTLDGSKVLLQFKA